MFSVVVPHVGAVLRCVETGTSETGPALVSERRRARIWTRLGACHQGGSTDGVPERGALRSRPTLGVGHVALGQHGSLRRVVDRSARVGADRHHR